MDLVSQAGQFGLVYLGIYVACLRVWGGTRTRMSKGTVKCEVGTDFEFPRKILKDRLSILSRRKFGHDIK